MFQYLKQNPRFTRYWIASWLSELGDNLRNFALTFVILEQQGSQSSIPISVNLFCEYAPVVVFGFLIGVYADRWDRKRTVMGAIFTRSLIMLLIIVAIQRHSLLLLYACSFCSAICTAVFRASTNAFTMLFIEREDRKVAAGLRQMAISVLSFVGPPIATYFYSTIGAGLTLTTTAVLFIAAILLLGTIRVPKTGRKPDPSERVLASLWSDLRAGFRYSLSHRPMKLILGSNLLFGISAGVANTMSIFLVTEYYHMPKEIYAVVGPVEGAGMLLCTALFSKWNIRSERLVPFSLLMMGVGLIGFVYPKNIYLAFLSGAILAGGIVGNNISTSVLFQTRVDFEFQGRSSMITQACWMGTMVLLMPICGWLHNVVSVAPQFAVAGLTLVIGASLLHLNIVRRPLQEVAAEPLQPSANA